MGNIRLVRDEDLSRVAEIMVFNYRLNFYPIFKNAEFYFKELTVTGLVSEFLADEIILNSTYVYEDDGIIKGFVRSFGGEVEKLFIEPAFQSEGIGSELLEFAKKELNADNLLVLEANTRAIKFYKRHGFELTGEKVLEDGWIPLLRMIYNESGREDLL